MRGVWIAASAAAAALALCGAQASAAVLFSDNFEAEVITSPEGYEMNYASFDNFFVGEGTVDLLGTPNGAGLVGDGKFVDLDGSSGQAGYLETIQQFDVAAGQLVTLTFSGGGSQRPQGGVDNLYGGFRFFGTPSVRGVTLTGFATAETSNAPTPTLFGVDPFVFATDPYQSYSISFRTNTETRFTAVIGTGGGDNIGPLVDNVTITAAAVPEPATWGLMILGFGTAGAMLRRRRAGPAVAAA